MKTAHSIIRWQSYVLMVCGVSLWDKPAHCEERITEGALTHALLNSSANHGTSSGSSTRNSSGSSTEHPTSDPASENKYMPCLSIKLVDIYTELYKYIVYIITFFCVFSFFTCKRAFIFVFLLCSRPGFACFHCNAAVGHWRSEMLQSVFKVCGVTDVGFSIELFGCGVTEETPGVSVMCM